MRVSILLFLLTSLTGCIAVKAVDTAADIAIGTASGTIKITGKVIDAAIPDGDSEQQ